jgi:CubicO group peptidase (beta-lactamase class C family)
LARDSVAKGVIPSVAFALVQEGRIVHEGAVGSTPHTPYPLASVTKPIAATALMTLVKKGAIDLDEPAQKGAPYTVRQVLSHTAGLGTYARIYWADQQVPTRPLAERIQAYGFAAQPPGTVFEYSNLGYGLVGEIIEAKASKPLEQVLRETVFEPLGMRDSQLVNGFAMPEGAARKHGTDGKPLADTANDTPAAGNVWASAHDLALFAAFSLGADAPGMAPILGADARRLMQTAAETQALHPYYGGAGYGLGWYVQNRGGEPVVWHEGGMPGASSIIVMLPRRGLAAVVLINANDVNTKAQEIASALLRAVAPDAPPISLVATDGFKPFSNEADFAGTWSGHIEIDGKRRRWTLAFGPDGKVKATFPGAKGPATAYAALVHGPLLVATFPGHLPSRDVDQARDGFALLRMIVRGDELTGMAVAYSSEQRLEHLYPFRARLTRAKPRQAPVR